MVSVGVTPVYNWRNKKNKNDLYPIHLRIRINGTKKYYPISVPQKVAAHQWSGKDDAWVRSSHPFSFEINNKIKEKKDVVTELIKRSYNFNKSLSFPLVFRELQKSANPNSFNAFFEDYIKHPTDKLEPDTFKKYKACRDHLNAFNKNIRFHDLTPDLVQEFYLYCKVTKNLAGSTIDSYFDAFRKVVGLARRAHQISKEHEETLFEDLHIEIKKAKRTFLTIEEIRLWKNLTFNVDDKHLERTRDLFLLQIYTGFYFKDLVHFKKEYLVKDHEYGYMILGERDKNDEQNIIPLFKFPDAGKLIEKYASHKKSDPYVFCRDILLAEPVYNRQLKDVADIAGLTKNVSNKVARHTNAQLWIRLGTKKPVVSKMLGHSKEQTTDQYFSVNVIEVIEGTKHIDFRKLGL